MPRHCGVIMTWDGIEIPRCSLPCSADFGISLERRGPSPKRGTKSVARTAHAPGIYLLDTEKASSAAKKQGLHELDLGLQLPMSEKTVELFETNIETLTGWKIEFFNREVIDFRVDHGATRDSCGAKLSQ